MLLRYADLKSLDTLLQSSEYIERSELTHSRTDYITAFYYFKAILHGKEVRLNVAKKERTYTGGKTKATYFVYSVNDIKTK